MATLAELFDSTDIGLKDDLNDRLEQAKSAYRKQFNKELCECFGEEKVGFYGDGKKKIKDITVGIIGSVKNDIDIFKKSDLGLIITDECIPADSFVYTEDGPKITKV